MCIGGARAINKQIASAAGNKRYYFNSMFSGLAMTDTSII